MTKIYILFKEMPHDPCGNVWGVYSSREKAEEAIEGATDLMDNPIEDDLVIEEWIVDEGENNDQVSRR
jgi:hypothetical protein